MSVASNLALALSNRLDNITTANGYSTNIGSRVLRGRRRLDPSQLPCVVLIERDDTTISQTRSGPIKLKQAYAIEGHATCDPDNPNDVGHLIIADIKKAIFTGKFNVEGVKEVLVVNYVGRTIAPREEGLNVVSATVEVSIEYVEDLTNP